MSATIQPRKRKAPPQRREEIVAAASALALREGLQSLTLRRVAEALGVVPGLVNHYFPAVDDLAAAAFAHAASAERNALFAAAPPSTSPLHHMRALLRALTAVQGDAISLLWLDAWQATRTRPALRAEVTHQMAAWRSDLSRLIACGVASGCFRTPDPPTTATRILALLDGLSIQAAIRFTIGYATVRDLVVETIARELGLEATLLRQAAVGEGNNGTRPDIPSATPP